MLYEARRNAEQDQEEISPGSSAQSWLPMLTSLPEWPAATSSL
jgi:hypothetical protein